MNGGDTFTIGADQQNSGENIITFSQARNPSWNWGVTDILLKNSGTPLPTDISLTVGTVNSGKYGNNYAGQTDVDGQITASFTGTESDLDLSLLGYDVDFDDELEVLLNGSSIGFLSKGPNNNLNGGDTFTIGADQQNSGENIITFSQARNPSWNWGVTDILLKNSGTPLPSLPEPQLNTITGTSGSDFLRGTAGDDEILGLDSRDRLFGLDGNDHIDGGNGSDIIYGGADADILTGGTGLDYFVFNTPFDNTVDTIVDLSISDDYIVLDDFIFIGLNRGRLDASAFHIGSEAQDATDHIIYNSENGALYFDVDAAGGADAIQFAELTSGLTLSNTDFYII